MLTTQSFLAILIILPKIVNTKLIGDARERLDCVNGANHNLNRLLDEPDNGTVLAVRKYLF